MLYLRLFLKQNLCCYGLLNFIFYFQKINGIIIICVIKILLFLILLFQIWQKIVIFRLPGYPHIWKPYKCLCAKFLALGCLQIHCGPYYSCYLPDSFHYLLVQKILISAITLIYANYSKMPRQNKQYLTVHQYSQFIKFRFVYSKYKRIILKSSV